MIYRGRIRNGVVVFDDPDASITEGMGVKVEPLVESPEFEEIDPLFTMGDLAVETGVPDLSVNIDHYLYGHPKREGDGTREADPSGTISGGLPMNKRKLHRRVISGPKNLAFGDLVALVEAFGFRLDRTKGSHHIFVHPEVPELVNLQEENGKAKPYQVRQFLNLVEEYNLTLEDDLDEDAEEQNP